jgi:hypothetical protein
MINTSLKLHLRTKYVLIHLPVSNTIATNGPNPDKLDKVGRSCKIRHSTLKPELIAGIAKKILKNQAVQGKNIRHSMSFLL